MTEEEDPSILWGTLVEIEDHGGTEYNLVVFDKEVVIMDKIDATEEEQFITLRGVLGNFLRIRKDVIKVLELERVEVTTPKTTRKRVSPKGRKTMPALTNQKVDKPAG